MHFQSYCFWAEILFIDSVPDTLFTPLVWIYPFRNTLYTQYIYIAHGKRAVTMMRVSRFLFTQKLLNAPKEVFTSKTNSKFKIRTNKMSANPICRSIHDTSFATLLSGEVHWVQKLIDSACSMIQACPTHNKARLSPGIAEVCRNNTGILAHFVCRLRRFDVPRFQKYTIDNT